MAKFHTVQKNSANAERQPGNNAGLPKHNNRVETPNAQKPSTSQGDQQGDGLAVQPNKATEAERARLASYVETIQRGEKDRDRCFRQIVDACYHIQEDELYKKVAGYVTEAAFFKARFGYSRSHSLRLAQEGRLLNRLSPGGDNELLSSDAHCRPLLKLGETEQDEAIKLAKKLARIASIPGISAKLVETCVILLNPPREPRKMASLRRQLAEKFCGIVEKAKAALPKGADEMVRKLLDKIAKQALALGGANRASLIDWTDMTWDVQAGCSHCSEGCDHCWAAKMTATRMRDIFPGLAKETKIRGESTWAFTGKIVLLPEQLAEPLKDPEPKRYFLNSRSDTFHPDVPDEFIDLVFSVMEAAHWHFFQVLTKRPERMAEYTQRRYKDRPPPQNIWCGTSVENQETFDERIIHQRNVKAAVFWLSVEPMLGPIKFGDLSRIGWVVVGGESGSDRRMEKAWVIDARDQCKKFNVPFFFKQWGDFDEDGQESKQKAKKDHLIPSATLDGVVYDAYPEPPIAEGHKV